MKDWKKNFAPLALKFRERRPDRPLIPCLALFLAGIVTGLFLPPRSGYSTLIVLILFSLILLCILISNCPELYIFLLFFFLAGMLNFLQENHQPDLSGLINTKDKVLVQGTILSVLRPPGDTARFELRLEKTDENRSNTPAGEKILVTVYRNCPEVHSGDKVLFSANLRPFKNFNNPGRYNYEAAMRYRGLILNASVSDGRYIVPMGSGETGLWLKILESMRRPVRDFLSERLTPQNRAIYSALILGEKQGISPDLREQFNRTGLGHMLAVSGLHIGLIAWLSFFVFRWILSRSCYLMLRIDIRKAAALLTCVPVFFYTCLAGFQVSAVRAMIMVISYLVSILIEREKDIWSTLALAALIILATDPLSVTNASFQFTFLAVTGILWLVPVIQNHISKPFSFLNNRSLLSKVCTYMTGIVSASASAFIFLLPFLVYYFHRISLVSIPANLMTVPLLGFWVLPMGMASSLIMPFSDMAAALFLNAGEAGLNLMMKITGFWAGFKYSSVQMVTPSVFEIILFYCTLFCIIHIRKGLLPRVCLGVLLLAVSLDVSYWVYRTRFNRNLRVSFLDVGQGNAAFIQFPGKKRMLIDGGGFSSGSFDTGENIIKPFLLQAKIMRVHYVVLTHPHPDHMNGLPFIVSRFRPEELWHNGDMVDASAFKKLMEMAKSDNIRVLVPHDLPEKSDIGGVEILLLHPMEKKCERALSVDGRTLNNNSIVLKMSYQGSSLLFPGDIEQKSEELLVRNSGSKLNSDVLLVPHHGSRYSSSAPFLKMVSAGTGIVSSRSSNSFGFPHEETVNRLKQAGTEVLRIDRVGAVEVTAGKDGLRIRHYCSSSN